MIMAEVLKSKRAGASRVAALFSSNVFPEGVQGEPEAVAKQWKEWALRRGATHYAHWFQPLTGKLAEKHNAFLEPIEKFSSKELLRGEPDASSFPSGGLRATHEARGYTAWDGISPPFIWDHVLYIPALFFSWKGEALDYKLPLLRSEQKIDAACQRLLRWFGQSAKKVSATLGAEQEFFIVDRTFLQDRPDLLLTGRTLFGAKPPKGQELEEHYFRPLPSRVADFLRDVEEAALSLGIPLKARHAEVAPGQYEFAPIFEPSPLACDHNLLLMELMERIAYGHDLCCLFHEKPFAGLNGSGKHNNWSLMTDKGENLFDPRGNPERFFALVTALLSAVHTHSALLRASIASAGNDHRLGGSEAPPTIVSVYLGETLEQMVLHPGKPLAEAATLNLNLTHLHPYMADATDRNRTAFFAFTGNKFELRAVGSSAHCAWPMTVLNAIVADRLNLILDEAEAEKKLEPVLQRHLKEAKAVVYGGNCYSAEWVEEAARRKLPNIRKSFHAFTALKSSTSQRAFEEILSEHEIEARYEIFTELYTKNLHIELNLMIELFHTQILPAALTYQSEWAQSLHRLQQLHLPADTNDLRSLSDAIHRAKEAIDAIEEVQKNSHSLGCEAKGRAYCDLGTEKMALAREAVDSLERRIDHNMWPLPKYREILFL